MKKRRPGGGYEIMGLLTILKKMKQKERELRLLMLYPPGARAVARVAGPPDGRSRARGRGRRGYPLPVVRHARGATTARPGAGGGPYHSAGPEVACKSQPGGLKARPRRGIPVSRRGAMQWR